MVDRRSALRSMAGAAAGGAVLAATRPATVTEPPAGDPWTTVGANDGDYPWPHMSTSQQDQMARWIASHGLELGQVRYVEFWPGFARIHGCALKPKTEADLWIRTTTTAPPPFIAQGLP